MLRLLLPFVLGILLSLNHQFQWLSGWNYLLVVGAFTLLLSLIRHFKLLILRSFGLMLLISLVILGYWRTSMHYDLTGNQHWSQFLRQDSSLVALAKIRSLSQKEERLRMELSILQIQRDSLVFSNLQGNAYLSTKINSQTVDFHQGDLILVQGIVKANRPPPNPKAFDFSAYLANHNIFFQIRPKQLRLAQKSKVSIISMAEKCRVWALLQLQQSLKDSQQLAVASALILGHRDDLDQDIKTAYQNTGAVHILAVSGLHVGIIAQLITWLFWLWPAKRLWSRIIKLAVVLFFIWFFALITGLSPSVSRASLMFSLIAIGQFAKGRHSLYNTLASSALILLLINPFWLFDIGFQLSYLAVLGIVVFQPHIASWFYFRQKLLRWTWQLTSLSIAAQLTTFPLTLYYFHQFPSYFLLSGLVVPLVAPILLFGLITIFFAGIPVLGPGLAWCLSKLLWLCNSFIFGINQLPGASIKGLWLSPLMTLCLFLLIASIALYSRWPKAGLVVWAQLSLLGFLVCLIYQTWHLTKQAQLVIYHIPKHSLIDFYGQSNAHSLASQELEDYSIYWTAANYRSYRGVKPELPKIQLQDSLQMSSLYYHNSFGNFQNLRFGIIDTNTVLPNQPLSLDLLLLRNNPSFSSQELSQAFVANTWVFDGSTPPWEVNNWKKKCKQAGWNCYFTVEQGAFILDLGPSPL